MGTEEAASAFAKSLGLELIPVVSSEWEFGTDGKCVVYSWHADQSERARRMWNGIAQFLLIDSCAGPCTVQSIEDLAERLSAPTEEIFSAV